MEARTETERPDRSLARLALIGAVYVATAGGVMALAGQEPAWGVFTGIAVTAVLIMRNRGKTARSGA